MKFSLANNTQITVSSLQGINYNDSPCSFFFSSSFFPHFVHKVCDVIVAYTKEFTNTILP